MHLVGSTPNEELKPFAVRVMDSPGRPMSLYWCAAKSAAFLAKRPERGGAMVACRDCGSDHEEIQLSDAFDQGVVDSEELIGIGFREIAASYMR